MRWALAILIWLAAPAAAESSDGVRRHATIAEEGVVSARAVGEHLYVSALTGVPARVASWAAPGTPLEMIGYVDGPGDVLPLDDRGVDRGVVGTWARASGAARAGFCRL